MKIKYTVSIEFQLHEVQDIKESPWAQYCLNKADQIQEELENMADAYSFADLTVTVEKE